ncbi:MAG TPA: VanZ family protein [Candidatus Binatia bacterium]
MDFGAIILWMGLIFSLSTASFSSAQTQPLIVSVYSRVMPGFAALGLETADLLVRKMAHLSEYFILGILVTYTLQKRSALTTASQLFLATAIGIIYAISDEWHQFFVPGRTASAMDVLFDTIGFTCGSLCFYVAVFIRQPKTVQSDTSPPSHYRARSQYQGS